jgi:hypothetical protein
MVRRYRDPITVSLADGLPAAFTWRGVRYVVAVIGTWQLAARWWDAERATERTYFRVQARDLQVFEIYHDVVSGAWVLDVCQD